MKKSILVILMAVILTVSFVSCIESVSDVNEAGQEKQKGFLAADKEMVDNPGVNEDNNLSDVPENIGDTENPVSNDKPEELPVETPVDTPEDTAKTYKAYNIRTHRYIEGFTKPKIVEITSKDELDKYLTEPGLEYCREFIETVSRYGDDYFTDNILVMVVIPEKSSTPVYAFNSLDDTGTIHLDCYTLELQNGAMEEWHIVIEVPNTHPAFLAGTGFTIEGNVYYLSDIMPR